ncbi:SDR family oxidoreductase [Mesorhizobium sp. CAU 1741]|uniref:SDR family NAD(P)-dependent oxidoreductase n=1 Tax=Mesorhizobium sp. CAU 1741 TaxID=3140366 RepID=UPI00325B6958
MVGRFNGKVALVTGAAGGIGRATALRLAREGARVVAADRDRDGLEMLASELEDLTTLIYDAADGDGSAAMARSAIAGAGRLDMLVCNAGIYRRSHFVEIGPDEWNTVVAVNLTSVARIAQAAVPALIEARGSAVFIASTAATHGIAYAAHYAAAKAGIVALMKSLAVEYAHAGVRFNAVAPGRVKTAIASNQPQLERQNASLLVRAPRLAGLTEGGEPEDIAGVIGFLLSQDARYVSGSLMTADGAQNVG